MCSLVGLAVILPINYGVEETGNKINRTYSTMDSFTISNVSRGSRRCVRLIYLAYIYLVLF